MRPIVPILGALGLFALVSSSKGGGGASPRSCAKKLVAAFVKNAANPKAADLLDQMLSALDVGDPAIKEATLKCFERVGATPEHPDSFVLCRNEMEDYLASALTNATSEDLRSTGALLAQVAPQLHLHECLTALADQKLKASA